MTFLNCLECDIFYFLKQLLAKDGYLIRFATEEVKCDRDVVRMSLGLTNGLSFEHASELLKKDKDFVFEVSKEWGNPINHAILTADEKTPLFIKLWFDLSSQYQTEQINLNQFNDKFNFFKDALGIDDFDVQQYVEEINHFNNHELFIPNLDGNAIENLSDNSDISGMSTNHSLSSDDNMSELSDNSLIDL